VSGQLAIMDSYDQDHFCGSAPDMSILGMCKNQIVQSLGRKFQQNYGDTYSLPGTMITKQHNWSSVNLRKRKWAKSQKYTSFTALPTSN